jgi:hypothetical protein
VCEPFRDSSTNCGSVTGQGEETVFPVGDVLSRLIVEPDEDADRDRRIPR